MNARWQNLRAHIRENCSLEFLGLCTALIPAVLAGAGFFFGRTVSAGYFYGPVAVLLGIALIAGWRRFLSYLLLLAGCALLTAYTFSYVGNVDTINYHFPMQCLLRQGWNPVFESTLEKFSALAGDAAISPYHTLFLPKFTALFGAIVASALRLFSGDVFLGYLLLVCLFLAAATFARRFYGANRFWQVIFAAALAFTSKTKIFLAGQIDYTTYASFCIAALMLALYVRDRRLHDLALVAASVCICMTAKTTGILACGVLFVMTLPWLFRRPAYWRTLALAGVTVAILGASPLLTAWIQYGSPFYPSMSFNPLVPSINITSDFTGNADALSMGYLSRICYAWVSPKLTVGLIRLFDGNPAFNPVFTVVCGVGGGGPRFRFLLLVSVLLLVFSRKNFITYLCLVIFVSSNFAPLKYIGYNRYFPQIWAIFPLAVLNFVYAPAAWPLPDNHRGRILLKIVTIGLSFMLICWTGLSVLRTMTYQGRFFVLEKLRQDAIAELAHKHGTTITVGEEDYLFTSVQRFRQAGVKLVKAKGDKPDTVMQRDFVLPGFDAHPEIYDDWEKRFPPCDNAKDLLFAFHWRDLFKNIPRVLWD